MGEALERFVASVASTPTEQIEPGTAVHRGQRVIQLDDWTLHSSEQRADPAFPEPMAYPTLPSYTQAYDLSDNTPVWVPAALVALRRDFGALSTSSGLAADFSPMRALLRAVQELVERDAYVTTWVHGLAGRRRRFGDSDAVRAYDVTPDYSPHRVACVAGTLPLRGLPRHSLGLACRASWEEAVEKAYLEFVQGTMFAGHQLAMAPELHQLTPSTCTGFDQHAVYWSTKGDAWWDLPLHADPTFVEPARDEDSSARTDLEQLTQLVAALRQANVRVFYRLLPNAAAGQLGLRVVRAMSPDLVPLHHDHNWPFLGGTASDRSWRYPNHQPLVSYPSPHPHGLG